MPFDVTEMRARLNEFMKEINDAATSPEDVERYAKFNAALHEINEQTDYYYQPREDGTYPPLDADGLKKLQEHYNAALEQSRLLLSGTEGGAVAERMRLIARELQPLLRSDSAALDMADSQNLPLPELIGRAREQAVDLGEQQTTAQGGQLSARQHIIVENGENNSEDGYFTATSRVEPKRHFDDLMDSMAGKYPPQFRPFIEQMRDKYQDVVTQDYSSNPYWGILGDDTSDIAPDYAKRYMLQSWKENFIEPLELNLDGLDEDPQYLTFMDELYNRMAPVFTEYKTYRSGFLVNTEEGANIDRRNVGMTRVAALLGKPDLTAKSRPMMLIQNGVPVSGTFMQTASGVDLTNTKPDAAILSYTAENFNNPQVFDDIAAMQGLDFICGNIDRHPGNFFMRFDPPDSKDGKLVGITLIDNDLSFSDASDKPEKRTGSKFVLPDEMGVIGEDFYNSMKVMTKETLQAELADCGLSGQEIDWAWARKEALQAKIEADLDYYKDKAPGYVESGRLRVVPNKEWGSYSIERLAALNKENQFATIIRAPKFAYSYQESKKMDSKRLAEAEPFRRAALGLPPEEEKAEPAPKPPVPKGRIVGSGLAQERDPLNVARPDTLKLATPGISNIRPVGNNLSRRYPISWREGGEVHNGFLTPELSLSAESIVRQSLNTAIEQNPRYADVLKSVRDYYTFDPNTPAFDLKTYQQNVSLPGTAEQLPWEEMGVGKALGDALVKDPDFAKMWQQTSLEMSKVLSAQLLYGLAGVDTGRRIDLRNVAMSDVGDVLGVPNLLARSRTVQLEADGQIINGVVMEASDGFEANRVRDGEPMARITAAEASEVYNTESGVKSLADIQILDYVCMNRDRHVGNMFFRFDGLEEGKPRFAGVKGIDNDYSFGTLVPDPKEHVDKLSSLNDMQVISEGMAEKIRDPTTKDAIADKMRQNGMPQSEIDAAWKRIDAVNAHVKAGKLRIVKDGEWGKEPNTIEALGAGGDSSIFQRVKQDVIDPMAKLAEKWNALPEEQKIPPAPKPGLQFTGCVKVEGFGRSLKDNTELAALREQARRELSDRIAKSAEIKDAPEPLSEKDALANILAESKAMSKQLAAADPLFHLRSVQYRDLRRSADELVRLAQRLSKRLPNPEDELSADDRQKLSDALSKVTDRSTAYQMKKMSDAEDGIEISNLSEQKMRAAGNASFRISSLRASFDRTVSAREAQKNPMSYVHNRLNQAKAELSGATGAELRRKAAETIYLKVIAQSGMKFKTGDAIRKALRADVMAKNRDAIMRSPVFESIMKMPDDELRSLAAQQKGDMLVNRYVIETAKAMKTQKAQAQQEMKKTQVKEHALAGQGGKITEGTNKQSEVKEVTQPNSPVMGK